MIPLAIAMALVTQTYGGQMSVVPNLSAHDCAEAQCVAQHSKSCEAQAADDAQLKADEAAARAKADAWLKDHPKDEDYCPYKSRWMTGPCYGRNGSESAPGFITYTSPNDIRTAECVQ